MDAAGIEHFSAVRCSRDLTGAHQQRVEQGYVSMGGEDSSDEKALVGCQDLGPCEETQADVKPTDPTRKSLLGPGP